MATRKKAAPRVGASLKNVRCLVTGASGFLGSHLASRLAALGADVVALDAIPAHEPIKGVDYRVGDIRDRATVEAACEGVDAVFHTVAITEFSRFVTKARRALVTGVNVDAARQLAEVAAAAGVRRFVHTSSIHAVMGQPNGSDESCAYTTEPDMYCITKRDSEKAVLALNAAQGMRVCAVRPGGIYGEGEKKFLIMPFLKRIAAGESAAFIGPAARWIDHTWVENLVDAELLCAERMMDEDSPVPGSAYFITDDQPVASGLFFKWILEEVGVKAPEQHIPERVIAAVADVSERVYGVFGKPEPMVTRMTVKTCIDGAWFDMSKARRELGYDPQHNTRQVVAKMGPWLRARYRELAAA